MASRRVKRSGMGIIMKIEKSFNILKKSIWVVMLIQMIIIIVVVNNFQVDDKSLGKGKVFEFNRGWVLTREDGSSFEIPELPYSEKSNSGAMIVVENTIPKAYAGMSLSFLSADKEVRVYIDDEVVYEFGKHDRRKFGKTPGSIVNFVDIPYKMESGRVKIEMISPYDDFAANISEMFIAPRDIAVANLMKKNMINFLLCGIIVIVGFVLMAFTVVRYKSEHNTGGVEYLGLMCLVSGVYYTIETKSLSIFYGNQTLYSILVFFILMLLPAFLLLYFDKTLSEHYPKRFKLILLLCILNTVIQLTLQLTNTVDFMNMAFMSHILIFVSGIVIIISSFISAKRNHDNTLFIECLAVTFLIIGAVIDIVRTYVVHVGDLGMFSRVGMTLFAVTMLLVHIAKHINKNIGRIQENAEIIEREMKNVERQNQILIEAKVEADKAKAEAIQANKAKSTFLANMSHEIRTPINAVLGMDTMILRECDDEAITEYAINIQNAGTTLLGLVNDILDFSKIESGKMDIIKSRYSVAELLKDVYNMVSSRANDKGLKFVVTNSHSLPSELLGDEVRIKQIIINLLTNAVKYTKEGKVILHVDWKLLDEENIVLHVIVKDTGMGISEENLDKLFKSFQRIDEKKNRNIEGTGLGLNITKQLVDLMDGKIEVESEYGKGSKFSVNIPQKIINIEPLGDFTEKYKEMCEHTEKYRESFRAPAGRILVVDDVPMNLRVIEGLLKRTHINIDTALSAAECLKKISNKKYHMIFLDHMMPDMDGVETIKEMKKIKDNLNDDTSVIMLTANALIGAREEYIEIGFSDYLSKPIQPEKLEELILKYLPEKLILRVEEEQIPEEEPEVEEENKEADKEVEQSKEDNSDNIIKSEFLEKISYLDTETGMNYCCQDENIYRTVINEYVKDDRCEELEKFYLEEDWQNYRIRVHGIKSTSYTIGATELADKAKDMEMAAKELDAEYIKQHHDELMHLYGEVLIKLRQI